ncbi:pyridoxamine 5'-phosphate oxidase family protein [Staphylospora marina]|uniref:pyridoxamine 5'-phosphate oxidase family protein n=1 Tax=Staphylospora marina TaxID=2490858 RepID=UPI000F5BDAB1|nr:pyridoxamine 5'-phosphate oxidase family protein [Staphylospora marina]
MKHSNDPTPVRSGSTARFRPLRRTAKEVTDPARIGEFLRTAHVGALGLSDEEGTYVVPLNFVWHNGRIYFHGSDEGRKADAIKRGGTVCFSVFEEIAVTCDPVPALTGAAYFSVMVFGHCVPVENLDEKTEALQAMLDKYVPGYFSEPLSRTHVDRYRSGMGSPTVVYRIDPVRITAKEDNPPTDKYFVPGRTKEQDLKRRKA